MNTAKANLGVFIPDNTVYYIYCENEKQRYPSKTDEFPQPPHFIQTVRTKKHFQFKSEFHSIKFLVSYMPSFINTFSKRELKRQF